VTLAAHRSIGHLSGTFVTKTIKAERYYYFQYSDPGGAVRQNYVGKKRAVLDRLVRRFKTERALVQPDLLRIRRLCAQLRIGGALITDGASARVLRALADGGVFALQGVLVGTHAFTVLGNLLGVRWHHAALKTHDTDLASDQTLTIAVPHLSTDIPKILDGLQMGFLPVPAFNLKAASTSFKVRGHALRLDMLTPGHSANPKKSVHIPRFNVAAYPLPYLDYLIEYPEQGAVLGGGGLLVNVPSPARFALHKMIVSRERSVMTHDKIAKDLHQAAQLIEVLAEERPGDIDMAWEALVARGPAWVRKCQAAWQMISKRRPDLTRYSKIFRHR